MAGVVTVVDNGKGEVGILSVENLLYEGDKKKTADSMEAFPSAEHYQVDGSDLRPSLAELIKGEVKQREEKEEVVETRKGKVIKFGWFEGVMLRCLLNIWGTMLFLRLTWVIGQAGLWQGLLVVTLCNIVTFLSALSMSAISSNGHIPAGGVYYIISRSLGPAIGGSIGLMFTIANTISVGTYTVGFSSSFLDLLTDAVPGYNGIVDHGCRVDGCRDNDTRIVGGITLVLFLLLAIAGMDWVTRVQKSLLVLLVFAQIDMLAGSLIDIPWGTAYVEKSPEGAVSQLTRDQRHAYGFTGWSWETAKENLPPNYMSGPLQQDPAFMDTFGVFFTAVTGIVAGANLSGDLKDPASAIPKGTLWAIIVTWISYGFFAFQTGFVFNNRASGISEEFRFFNNRSIFRNGTDLLMKDPFWNGTSNGTSHPGYPAKPYIELPRWTDCSDSSNLYRDYLKMVALPKLDSIHNVSANSTSSLKKIYDNWNSNNQDHGNCTYGSGMNQLTMTYITFTGWLSYAGCYAASLSSAIASLIGAPRILQAVGKDGIYPGIGWFEKGGNANNDPIRGYFLCFAVAMGFVMIANLNVIGIVASNFFLASYALLNLSCFHSSYTNSPGWRPSFIYYNKWVALFSAVLCVALMFMLTWTYAAATVICQIVLGAYIYYRKPDANWGSSVDAFTFNSALSNIQEITDHPEHVKNFRPKILVLSGHPASRPALVDFAHLITKNLSLLVCGHVVPEKGGQLVGQRERGQQWLKQRKVSGFYTVVESNTLSGGARVAMTVSGLGKLSPNSVMVGFKQDWKEDPAGLASYLQIMFSAFELELSFAILRCQDGLDLSDHFAPEKELGNQEEKLEALEKGGKDEEDGEEEEEGGGSKKSKPSIWMVSTQVDSDRLDSKVVTAIQQFKEKRRRTGTVDVWWLFDDGGLTLLIPHIVMTRKRFRDCSLRVFALGMQAHQLEEETRKLTNMLDRFRINASQVTVIPRAVLDWGASPHLKAEWDELVDGANIPADELEAEAETTNRQCRQAELLRQHSSRADLVVVTLPLPKLSTSGSLYSAWLDLLTKDLPATLLVRGNQQSVLTFYS